MEYLLENAIPILNLVFLIIIASQNSARGGMHDSHLRTMIGMLGNISGCIKYLTSRQRILDRASNSVVKSVQI